MAQSSERRSAVRRTALVPVQIDTPTRSARLGVTRDVSESGALIASSSPFEIGEPTWLTLQVSMRETVRIRGRIVRLELGSADLFRYNVAVRFDQPLSAELIAEAARAVQPGRSSDVLALH
jgi:hypothetical protein